ncbi:MAG: helix-turn-helix transcriptional regulator [Prevotella sp.]|nr:helix-turn-helix transcriptional regulator [Prevotella sp.]
MENHVLNRIKVILVEKNRTARWLARELGKDPTTISKWCTNQSQPTLELLIKIADLLEVDYTELVKVEADKNEKIKL